MLNIYTGRESLDAEKFIISRIDPKGRALIIVPDQYTLEAERRLFSETGASCLMDVEVTSMSRLGYRLLNELGGSRRTFLDKYGRHMILSRVAAEHKDDLMIFSGLESRTSFLEMVNNFISEMKQYNSGMNELEEVREKVPEGSYSYRKLSDLMLLYGEYEKAIAGKYTDSEDYIDLFLGKIGESELIRENTIWIYGFDSFAPKALSVIGELMTYAKDVNLVLTCSLREGERDEELFGLGRMVIRNIREMCESRRIDFSIAEVPEEFGAFTGGFESAVSKHIERELYALPARPYKGEGGPVFVEASNLYNEAENAAAYILGLIRDEGLRLGDIKIILNDQDVRGPIVKRVFEEYGLDIFMDQGRDLDDNPIIRYIMSLLDAAVENYSTQAVMTMLKTGLAGLDSEEISDLENYAVKYRIRGTMWLKPFRRGSFEYDEKALGRLNDLRERAVIYIKDVRDALKAETYGEFIAGFYEILRDRADLPSKIEALIKAQLDENREDLAEETDEVWDSFLGICQQIKEIMGSDPFDPKGMRDLLQVGLDGIKVGMLPPSKDGLLMGTMQRTRTGRVRATVVLGANEGILPSGKPPQGIFGEEEKELFLKQGIEFSKTDSIVIMEEKMGIYRNLSRCGERLYVSYSMSDLDGNSSKPSSIWLKLREIFPDAPVIKDAVSSMDMKVLLNGEKSGLRHLANALEKAAEGEEVSQGTLDGLNWYKLHDKGKLDTIRHGLEFTNKAEDLGREMASRLYKRDPSGEMSVSPSRIEKYSRCPFSHFISYGLRPEERRVFEVAPREIGDVYHNCLMKLTDRLSLEGVPLTDPRSPWMTVTDEELEELVKEFVGEETASYRDGVFRQGNEEDYRAERITDACVRVAKNLVEQVRAGMIISGKFEAPFGRGREIPPVVIDLGEKFGNEKAYIEGKIDRVDYLPDSRVKIIDYKTGNEEFTIKEAEKGYRLQLMLYLEAAIGDTGKPAGVFYFHIQEPMVNMTEKTVTEENGVISPDREELRKEIAKEFKLNGVMVDDPDVIRNIAGDFEGYSDIVQLRNGKEGIKSGTRGEERLLSEDDFNALRNTVCDAVSEKVTDLLLGKVPIYPMKTRKKSACTYCEYKGICRFDTVFEGNKWNPVE